MAKHETEMHAHRRKLLAALRKIVAEWDNPNGKPHAAIQEARRVLADPTLPVAPPCDHGLFADRAQLDLMDRTDLT